MFSIRRLRRPRMPPHQHREVMPRSDIPVPQPGIRSNHPYIPNQLRRHQTSLPLQEHQQLLHQPRLAYRALQVGHRRDGTRVDKPRRAVSLLRSL